MGVGHLPPRQMTFALDKICEELLVVLALEEATEGTRATATQNERRRRRKSLERLTRQNLDNRIHLKRPRNDISSNYSESK